MKFCLKVGFLSSDGNLLRKFNGIIKIDNGKNEWLDVIQESIIIEIIKKHGPLW